MIRGRDSAHNKDSAGFGIGDAGNPESPRIYLAVPQVRQIAGRQMTPLKLQRLTAANDNRPSV